MRHSRGCAAAPGSTQTLNTPYGLIRWKCSTVPVSARRDAIELWPLGHRASLQRQRRAVRDYGEQLEMGKPALTVGLLVDHAKAVRIPLLIILFGVIMTFWVDQIWELFLLLVLPNSGTASSVGTAARSGALVMAGCLGFAVWHTARTVYRFDIRTLPTLSDPKAESLREWLPRSLGAAIPLLMAVGTAIALRNPSVKATGSLWMPILFASEAIVLFAFFVARRHLFAGVGALAKHPSGDPRVSRWSQLPASVRVVYAAIMIANLVALILAAREPGLLAKTGALGVVLLSATFLTVTGTYLTIQAARWQFPLLTALFVLACALQFFGCNDNHRVRLYVGMHSFDTPSPVDVDSGAPLPTSFVSYAAAWDKARPASSPVYLVSSEGGGIRAAAWTLLVLSRLEVASHGEFSKHMLLGSGVSGGSLGLAWFAALVNGERHGVIRLQDIDTLTKRLATADYLGPTVETMFLTDFLQRFWFRPAFVDRGERLESRFELAWAEACRGRPSAAASPPTGSTAEQAVCSQFARPWKDLWAGTQQVPLLFLNSTEVQTGQRFVQEPFQSLRAPTQDMDVANFAAFSYGLLPASSPLSAVVHNSARFTYVSPAGSLTDAALLKQGKSLTRQLVDGGYFENQVRPRSASCGAAAFRVRLQLQRRNCPMAAKTVRSGSSTSATTPVSSRCAATTPVRMPTDTMFLTPNTVRYALRCSRSSIRATHVGWQPGLR